MDTLNQLRRYIGRWLHIRFRFSFGFGIRLRLDGVGWFGVVFDVWFRLCFDFGRRHGCDLRFGRFGFRFWFSLDLSFANLLLGLVPILHRVTVLMTLALV